MGSKKKMTMGEFAVAAASIGGLHVANEVAEELRKKKSRKKTRKGRMRSTARVLAVSGRELLAQVHSASITSPLVMDFGDPTLREAFRIWWHPYDLGPDFDALTGQDQRTLARGDSIERRKIDPGYYRRISSALSRTFGVRKGKRVDIKPKRMSVKAKVAITLTYPLSERRTKIVTIDRRYPGAIFGLTHDFYRELYAEDEKRGGKAGPAKRGTTTTLLNRGRGPLVWGHDLGDLVIETCQYRKLPVDRAKKLGAEGEFTFSIGS